MCISDAIAGSEKLSRVDVAVTTTCSTLAEAVDQVCLKDDTTKKDTTRCRYPFIICHGAAIFAKRSFSCSETKMGICPGYMGWTMDITLDGVTF